MPILNIQWERLIEQVNCLLNSNVQLVVDDGPENNGAVNDFLSIPVTQFKKIIAQVDILQSNSMIEAANKRIKYDYLFTKELLDFEAVKIYISNVIESFNNKPFEVLTAYTPVEVLEGAIRIEENCLTNNKYVVFCRLFWNGQYYSKIFLNY